jgi:nitric oxide reductase large subunit
MLILTSLVLIIVLLAFIALMIFIIGYNLDKSQK